MKEFHEIAHFIEHLATMEVKVALAERAGLERAARVVEKEAKAIIGNYQSGEGPFQDWETLADSTQEDRARQGYPIDEPLLRDGKLRDSIMHEVDGTEAIIGSELDIALYQEVGTEHIPPRSFLGIAAMHTQEKVGGIIGHHAVAAIVGGMAVESLDEMAMIGS